MQESEDRYPRPIATVDAVILTLSEGKLQVLLHRRPQAPFAGAWALPGGFIRVAEDADTEAAIGRVLREKAGATGFWVEQLATFSGPVRDPRGWSRWGSRAWGSSGGTPCLRWRSARCAPSSNGRPPRSARTCT